MSDTGNDTERRLRAAYDDLRPAPDLWNAVEAQLDGHRRPSPRSPRVRRWLGPAAAAAVLLALALAWHAADDDPLADGGPAATLEVRIRDGELSVQPPSLGGEWSRVTLGGLGKFLEDASTRRHQRIVIRTGPRTPWVHVQWVMLVCAEKKRPRLALAAGDGEPVPAPLPVGDGPWAGANPPFRVLVEASATGRPAYHLGANRGNVTEDEDEVARALAKRPRPTTIGEIKAAHSVPAAVVTSLVRRFREAGLEHVRFFGTEPISRVLRSRVRLPAPTTDWGDPLEGDREILEDRDIRYAQRLAATLEDGKQPAAERARAARALIDVFRSNRAGRARNDAFRALCRALPDTPPDARIPILRFVGESLKDENTLHLLAPHLVADDAAVRAAAVDAAHEAAGERAVPWIAALGDDPSAAVRERVAAALGPDGADAARLAAALTPPARFRGLDRTSPLAAPVVDLVRDPTLPFPAWRAACAWLRATLAEFPAHVEGEPRPEDRARIAAAFAH